MPRSAKLKVYRTAIGFHDAYVAAPSQKAALTAWGSDKDLFARGVAELVEDEALTAEPLALPGKIIRRLRGTAEEQIAALPSDAPRRARAEPLDDDSPTIRRNRVGKIAARRPSAPGKEPEPEKIAKPAPRPKPRPAPKPKPKPSRAALDEAEHAASDLKERHAAQLEELRTREEALKRERRVMAERQEDEAERAAIALSKAERAYCEAITAWASS